MAGAYHKLLAYLMQQKGKVVDRGTLSKVAGVHEWARVLRQMRQDGYDLDTLRNGYRLNSLVKKRLETKGNVNKKVRFEILSKYNSTCQRCGRTPKDGVKLHIDHIVPFNISRDNSKSNLWVLCSECNEGKKDFFKDQNAKTLRKILKEKSGKKRLGKYILANPNKPLEPFMLQIISRNREWTRELRFIRQELKIKILWNAKKGFYIYKTK